MVIIGWSFLFNLIFILTEFYIGIDHTSSTFFVGFTFLSDESEASYEWGLQELKEVFKSLQTPTIITGPGAISTDCDQALRNALSTVFPSSAALLCSWHTNKNIQQHCKGAMNRDTWERFIQDWNSIIASRTEEEYEERLASFSTEFARYSTCVKYVKSTWLQPDRKKALVHAWTNKYPHFGITVTSR